MVLLDYLKWRNDVDFYTAEFNDIDNVVLSYLAYIDFGELFGDADVPCNMDKALKQFCKKYSLDEIRENAEFTKRAPLLLEEMAGGERFRETIIEHYMDDFDKEKTKQFAAVTFKLPNGVNYISFRGTDSTITGWKESLLMSCTSDIEGAKEAVDYLNKVAKLLKGDLIIGGHSKGGNFAMYASAFCDDSIKKRIIKIYNNDGPGFRDEIIESQEYKQIEPKILSILPQTSIIGQLLSNRAEEKIIKSDAKGIFQHDPMTWEVTKNKFVAEELDDFSKFVKIALGSWLEKIDDETRESVVSTVFSMIEETKAETFVEFGGSAFKNTGILIKELAKLPKEKRKELMTAFGSLIQESGKAAFDQIQNKS